ncbi:MAG: ferrous iron transport protein A [Phycisphaerales bacterium]|nr:ferrous iron transport protein A [Phycisphaerales bacterium]
MAEQVRQQAGGAAGSGCDAAPCCAGLGTGQVVSLCRMRSGQCGIIRGLLAVGADGAYLRALGLRANQRIRLCRASGPWIVEVGCHGGPASRIGLARDLAAQVQVEIAG